MGAHPVVASDARVGERTPAWNGLLAHLQMPKVELNSVARVEPIIGPSLSALPGAAHPVSEQIAVARLPIQVSIRRIIKPLAIHASEGIVRVAALGSQIKFWQPGQLRDIKPGPPHRPLRISRFEDDLVMREPIAVER